jgi:hypothetical protein
MATGRQEPVRKNLQGDDPVQVGRALPTTSPLPDEKTLVIVDEYPVATPHPGDLAVQGIDHVLFGDRDRTQPDRIPSRIPVRIADEELRLELQDRCLETGSGADHGSRITGNYPPDSRRVLTAAGPAGSGQRDHHEQTGDSGASSRHIPSLPEERAGRPAV